MAKTELRIVKAKIKDILPNPFRDFELYPYSGEKIWRLFKSMRKTGWWGNVVGRMRKDGKVELAYGHHRVETLQRWHGGDWEIEVTIKELTDCQMLRIMSSENDTAYNCSAAAIDNSVKAAREYLRTHPGEARRVLASRGGRDVKRVREGAPMYATFLAKREYTVEKSIERLNLIDKGIVAKEALYLFPSFSSTDSFCKLVKAYAIDTVYQREVAQWLIRNKAFDFEQMKAAFFKFVPKEGAVEEGERLSLREIHWMTGLPESCRNSVKQALELMNKLHYPLVDTARHLEHLINQGKNVQDIIPQELRDAFERGVVVTLSWIGSAKKVLGIEDSKAEGTAPSQIEHREPEKRKRGKH